MCHALIDDSALLSQWLDPLLPAQPLLLGLQFYEERQQEKYVLAAKIITWTQTLRKKGNAAH